MVYCGTPSKGCGACRARKVKCIQVIQPLLFRANRMWRAVRSSQSLVSAVHQGQQDMPRLPGPAVAAVRDQSSSVAKRARSNKSSVSGTPPSVATTTVSRLANTPTSVQSSPSAESYPGDYSYDQHIDIDNFSLVPALIDRRQRAICYCLNSFAWLNGSLIKGLDHDADISQKAMMQGILAVGLANLSRTGPRSLSMSIQAQQEYYKALKLTNAAISHPTQALDDTTLTAILCMSVFEILTSNQPKNVDSFIRHTKGAIALLELRGESRLIETGSLQLFECVRSEIMVSCMMRWLPVPPTLLTLSEKALDAELEAMMNALPAEYAPEVHTLAAGQYFEHPTLGVRVTPLEGVYHQYQSFFHCSLYNIYHYGRIYANKIILNRLERMSTQPDFILTPEFKDTCQRLCSLSRQQTLGICAPTTPFLCGFLSGQQQENGTSPLLANLAGGLASLFPLWVAVGVDGHDSATCCWIQKTFNMIGREMGIDQALALAQIMPLGESTTGFVDRL